jgi:hypothetical protein
MTIEDEMELEYKRQVELGAYGRIPRQRQINQKVIDKRRKAAKTARKQRKKHG